MIIEDEELIGMYAEESGEHLVGIETDLLLIEEKGSCIDERLVNKVFRAAHSIKGGAGYMGLTNICELSHNMENTLDLIRRRKLIPDSKVITVLLKCFDRLKELIQNIKESNSIDINGYIDSLAAVTKDYLPEGCETGHQEMVDISLPSGQTILTVSKYDIDRAQREGYCIYLVEYTLSMIEVDKKIGRTILQTMPFLAKTGFIIDTKVDFSAIGTLDEDLPDSIPLWVLFATIIEPDIGVTMFNVDKEFVHVITENLITSTPMESDPVDTVSEVGMTAEASIETPIAKFSEEKSVPENDQAGKIDPETQTFLRVNVDLLDELMNLAGELVLCRNQLLQSSATKNIVVQENARQRIDMVTSELQEAIMHTRMQSIANVFNKFPRMIRDLSSKLGKKVELFMEGKDVELDKTIIEAIGDPLTHVVRNAVDHGIESEEERVAIGKTPEGKICLKSYHSAGQVNIEISDDGRGLNSEKIVKKAIKNGFINEQQASAMSEKEKLSLIFLPGVSTAESVSDVSGRGVGMDVVKTNLDKLGGIVEIDSEVNQGTVILIKIPLTLAIIPSQIIYAGKERYAIPQANLDELLIISADQAKDRIERVGDAEVVRLRGTLLPLIDLMDILEIEKSYVDPSDGREYPDRREGSADRRSKRIVMNEDALTIQEDTLIKKELKDRQLKDRRYHAVSDISIAVVSTGVFKYGLVVEKLGDSEEIVVKSIGRHLKKFQGYAGATIMGDGKVALILDIAGLAHMGKFSSKKEVKQVTDISGKSVEGGESKKEIVSLLLFKNAENEQFAAPMSLVERIESIDISEIELVGEEKVIRYQGGIIPVFRIDEVAQVNPPPERDRFEVIILKAAGKTIGLIATPPVDGVEVAVDMDTTTLKQPGIMGSALINDEVTLILDIFDAIKTLKPNWYHEQTTNKAAILFAEDSAFFRTQVKGYIEDDGYKVIEAENGLVAWESLVKHQDEVAAVVTDLSMPNMDGFELAARIKRDERFAHLPVIALTSVAAETDMVHGKTTGIDDYQEKLDRKKLLESIEKYSVG